MSTNPYPPAYQIRPQLLKVPEVAEMLGVKPRTIYEMVAKERIPYRKPPGSSILRFDLEEISPGQRVATVNEIASQQAQPP